MAAIVDQNNKLDINQLSSDIQKNLPAYARPIFIRILPEVPMTSTFKFKKVELQKDGYNIDKIKDPIYMLDRSGIYQKFTLENYRDILNGKLRI